MVDMGYYQHDGKLVAETDVELPAICVRCGGRASHYVKRKYANIGSSATLQLPMCEQHFGSRRAMVWCGWGGFLLGILMIVASIAGASVALVGIGFLVLLVAAFVGIFAQSRTGSPSTIDLEFVWVKGLSRKFLDQLPPFVD